MKAAVIYQKGDLPQYADMPAPIPTNKEEILVTVKAVAIKHVDKSRASGNHYSSDSPEGEGRIVGGDGVCLLPNGTRVYAIGASGMLAEQALIEPDRTVKVPEGLSDAEAAALPNAVIGAAMGLKFKADVQPGDVVLINGATGFTGRIAVQIAKHYGAKKVIATGRNTASLQELLTLGADEVIQLTGNDEDFKTQIARAHAITPIDVIIDYLWGSTAEVILSCLQGDGGFTNRIRYVSIGAMSGDFIQLSAANLRSVNLQLSGSGLGAWTKPQVAVLFREILPEMFELAATGKLRLKTKVVALADIARLWDMDITDGSRLVVTI
ncbi:zinc-binding alcohol dehydrogenase family protein [Mucilaginibacter sp. dw_454]|uniref:quinone oxidoreductase family protein n=1 Tax=Mucilaginibacter sp. dw_454 TaxID=2720079 RepID=UPI001BD27FB2|nr:zinc-binding alcohol dehydrogenase family protein [Mucilaginibacter sp. dw_454]